MIAHLIDAYCLAALIAATRNAFELLRDIANDVARRRALGYYSPGVTWGGAIWTVLECFIPVWNFWVALRAILVVCGVSLNKLLEILDTPLVRRKGPK
jgi:hypothetical protein